MDTKKRSRKDKKHKKRHRESRSSSSEASERESRPSKQDQKRPEESAGSKNEEKSLSIEETNKLRALLGLKPLQAPGAPAAGAGASSAPGAKSTATPEVFVKTRNMAEDKETERIRQKLELTREKRRVADVITDKPLAEDDSVDDIGSWIQRSRELELAKQREKSLAETEELIAEPEPQKDTKRYSSRDLAGLRVQHDIEKIKDERPIVLTLKDKAVLDEDEEGDILENVNIAEEERAVQNMANKKSAESVSGYGVVRYRPYDDEDGGEGTSLLNKYDEEIFGRKKQYFVLSGGSGEAGNDLTASERKRPALAKPSDSAPNGNGNAMEASASSEQKIEVDMDPLDQLRARLKMPTRPTLSARPAMLATTSLNNTGPSLASEYYTPEEMAAKFKKVRKVRKPIRALKADDLIEMDKEIGANVDAMEEDGTTAPRGSSDTAASSKTVPEPPIPRLIQVTDTQDFEPADAELEATLSRTKKLRELTAEVSSNGTKLSRRLPEHVAVDLLAQTTMQPSSSSASTSSGWVMLNQTSEFCRGVGDLPTIVVPESESTKPDKPSRDKDGTSEMEVEDDKASGSGDSESEKRVSKKKSSRSYRKYDDSDEEAARRARKSDSKVKGEPKDAANGDDSTDDEDVLGAEPKAASSIGEALRLASMKGYLEKPKESAGGTTVIGKVSQLQAQKYTVEERNHGDIDAKFSGNRRGGGGQSGHRGPSGPVVDFCEKSTYHPDVKLEYVDEAGKAVNQKEAFRLLSHRFHGKTSGKKKVERKLRKEAQERRILSQPSADTPLGTLGRLVARQQKEKSAFVVLSSSGTTGSVSISMPSASESPAKPKPKVKKPPAAGTSTVKSTTG